MSATGPEDLIAALGAKITGATADGHVSARLRQLSQAVLDALRTEDWPAASDAYEALTELAADDGDIRAHALAEFGRGTTLFRQPERWDEARASFGQAALLATRAGHATLAAKAHNVLAALAQDAGDLPASLAHHAQALELVDEAAEPVLAIAIYRSRATTHLLTGEYVRARADVERAQSLVDSVSSATAQQRDALGMELEADLTVLMSLSHPSGAGPLLEALYEQARAVGRTEILGDVALHRALLDHRARDLSGALRHAGEARAGALASRHPTRTLRYLAACLLIAVVLEDQGDRPGVIEILLTCKTTLQNEVGAKAGELLKLCLDLLPEKWGAPVFQEALATYRRRAQNRSGLSVH